MRRCGIVAAAAALVGSCATPQQAAAPEIAVTIDDLPVHAPYPPGVSANDVNAEMIAALSAMHVPATGFLNGIGVEQHPETLHALQQWHTAGLVVGNHTWSHRHLSEMSPGEFETELTRNQAILDKVGGETDWRWFRYPFLDEGENSAKRIAARAVLAAHHYRIAAVTMSFSDWQWTPAYARCLSAGNRAAVAELDRMYLDAAKENVAVARETARLLYGHDIPYVLLMHVSAMSAQMMPRLIQLYRDAGFRFVSLPQAESDDAYRAYTDLNLPPPLSLQEIAAAKGVRLPQGTDYSVTLNAICPGRSTASSP